MKKRKTDTNKKLKKTERKDLQSNITKQLLEAVYNLGHDADQIAKDLKKIGKELAGKLAKLESRKKDKSPSGKNAEASVAKTEDKSTKKKTGIARAEKVVAKVVSRKPKVLKENTEDSSQEDIQETNAPVKRRRNTSASTAQAEPTVKRRGRKPSTVKPADDTAKPVSRRGPRKKTAVLSPDETETTSVSQENPATE